MSRQQKYIYPWIIRAVWIKPFPDGKKSTSIDDRYLKIVENQLYGELMHALQMSKEELEHIIKN